ncbi:uncharacterized protein B0H18DRAFT_1180741 [Fomitopsis serialis]|uniref:uncharacterized protein n=1 Tax=Fomitopsis serialis TaxID=139415 RepID=UPI00200822F9|nr:uncharacterized protein B0H18DRAFT_1180741 [Neoantrodia serialis]KAH9934631.1 hypothetical protein B0H18DRAFT_1180741 [Neoantrodia serialis]
MLQTEEYDNADAASDEEEDSDDSGNDVSSEDDEEPPVENPSTHIRRDLEKALQGDLAKEFKGSHSSSRAYPTAPNPGLYLLSNNVGSVGLPLSTRDAAVVISGCKQAPFGQGERTVVNTAVRDTWEMDASQVQFHNPAWQGYLQGVVKDVCAELGVNMAVSQPRCELYKLLLYETGSHTEKVNGMFATIVVVLPSKYTGGEAHVSHGLLSTVYDTASLSNFQTTVLAWYTDVMHEIKPITSGYRLALSYNLLHTSNALRPSLPNNHAAVNALRHVLLSWKQANHDRVPRKIIYLLDHKYSQANLKGSALKGVDAHKLAILDALAKQLGFRLGMANLECRLSGSANDDGCHYGRRRKRGWYNPYEDYDESDDPDDVDFEEVEEREASITNLVTLDGEPLQDALEYDEHQDHTIPKNLINEVEAGPHDDQEYEGYMGNGAGSLERWYRRTVLIIWPQGFNLDMTFDDDISESIEDLAEVDSSKPHKRERKHVDFLLNVARHRPKHRAEIAKTLSDVACVWKDVELYERVIEACDASMIRTSRIYSTELIYRSLQSMLRAERSNFQRFQFIDELQNWFSAEPALAGEGVNAWIVEQRRFAMEHLKKPGPGDSQVFVDIALRNGGFRVLRDTFAPQLKTIADASFLVALVKVLQTEKIKPGITQKDQSILATMVADLLTSAIAKVDFFAPPARSSLMTPQTALRLVELSLATRNDELVEKVTQRLTDMTNVAPPVAQRRILEVLLPLLPLVDNKIKTRAAGMPAVPGIQCFYEATIDLCLHFVFSGAGPAKNDLGSLMDACVICGGVDVLSKKLWPTLKTSKPQPGAYADFIDQVRKRKDRLPPSSSGVSVDSIITEAVRQAIQQASFTKYTPTAYPYYSYTTTSANSTHQNRTRTLELLRLCLTTGNKASCSLVFKRLLDSSFNTREYVENVLIPFLPELRQFLTTNRIALSDAPFNNVFKSIVMLWANKVLGPKPTEMANSVITKLQSHGCKCAHCVQVFNFLTSSADKSCRMERIGAPKRKHVEQELNKYARTAATWSMIPGSPQGLTVTKADSIYLPVQWKATQARSAAILNSVSANATDLQKIFGPDHQVIMDLLAGRVRTLATAPSRLQSATATSSASVAGSARMPSGASAAAPGATNATPGIAQVWL